MWLFKGFFAGYSTECLKDGFNYAAVMDRFKATCMSPYIGECSLFPLDLSSVLNVLNNYHNETCDNGYYW